MRKKLNAGALYDSFPEGQTMDRDTFISECGDLTCPHKKIQDLTRMTMARAKQRTLGFFAKKRIDTVLKGN